MNSEPYFYKKSKSNETARNRYRGQHHHPENPLLSWYISPASWPLSPFAVLKLIKATRDTSRVSVYVEYIRSAGIVENFFKIYKLMYLLSRVFDKISIVVGNWVANYAIADNCSNWVANYGWRVSALMSIVFF
jgi:hypothetical protein